MPPKKVNRTKYSSSDAAKKVFNHAKPIPGKNKNEYRKDPYGNQIKKSSYGKDTKQGWNIDHIKPQSKGGSDDIRNLQALQSHMNKSKGDTLVKKSRHNQ